MIFETTSGNVYKNYIFQYFMHIKLSFFASGDFCHLLNFENSLDPDQD